MRLGISAVPALLFSFSHSASAEWGLNLTKGVTKISNEIYDLHMIIFYICVIIAVAVFGVMLYSIIYHRKSRGAKADNFHESTTVEIIWTVIPFLILILMAVPATSSLMDMYDASDSEIDIQVTGYQWKWRYSYINEQVDFFSNLSTPPKEIANIKEKNENYLLEVDNPLVLPINKKVKFLLTANDVIHSWWVPELGVKKDTIPGFINESWTIIEKPGIYRGQCTELCGKGHGFMPIVIKAVEQDAYDAWVVDQKALALAANAVKELSHDELMTLGEEIYNSNCAACHQTTGLGIPPVFPALKNSAIALGDVNTHMDIVLKGKPGTAMAGYADQLSVTEAAAVITFERNAWGNNTGDTVSPSQVDAYKNKN